ncbi:MAG: alpha/beta fold hydrolase [Phenylobacterium sp.]
MLNVNGVQLHYELKGRDGPPVVLVHGSWVDHANWSAVDDALARSFRVLAYDRRGHSRSERPAGQGSVDEDVADLAALIEALGLAPAHVVGNSFGAVIALRLACERPELFASLSVHEPPLIGLLDGDPGLRPMVEAVQSRLGAVAEQIARGDAAGASRKFVDEVALGPGSWDQLPPDMQAVFINNAPTFLDETREPQAYGLDLERLRRFSAPALLTKGDQSPPFFAPVLDIVASALPHARRLTFEGAGHAPQMSHPEAFVSVVGGFIAEGARVAA